MYFLKKTKYIQSMEGLNLPFQYWKMSEKQLAKQSKSKLNLQATASREMGTLVLQPFTIACCQQSKCAWK